MIVSATYSATYLIKKNLRYDAIAGLRILIHEVYTEAGCAKASPDWQRMRREYHTSSRHLADLATRARPGLLILYHQSYQFTESTEEDLMREMRAAYHGRFVSGHDLDVF